MNTFLKLPNNRVWKQKMNFFLKEKLIDMFPHIYVHNRVDHMINNLIKMIPIAFIKRRGTSLNY